MTKGVKGEAPVSNRHRNAYNTEVHQARSRDRAFVRAWLSFFTAALCVLMILVGFREMFIVATPKRIFLCAYAMYVPLTI